MKKNTSKKGFTLMELVVVIAILAVLGLLLYPQVTRYLEGASRTTAEANARTGYTTALFISATEGTTAVNQSNVQTYFSNAGGGTESNNANVTIARCTAVGECEVAVETNGYTYRCDSTGCSDATIQIDPPTPTPGS